MKDQYDSSVDPRDLTERLNRIPTSHSEPHDGHHVARISRFSRAGTTSSDTSSPSRLPTFRKSPTMSTFASDDTNMSLRSRPSAHECRENAEVVKGGFSKRRIGRERRQSDSSAKSHKTAPEFQYYGRHANSWLFNDFSITDSVKKGWSKVSRRSQE